MSKRILIFITLFSLGLIAISLYLISTLDPGAKPKPSAEVINAASLNIKVDTPFHLKYSDNKDFNLSDLQNKFTIIYFGFAHCPDICPATLSKMKEAIDLLTVKDLEKIHFIFISIDPERDRLADLNTFITQFGGNIKAVSGEKEELDKLASSLKVYYAKAVENNTVGDEYYVDHSSFIYFLNPKAELISQFTPNASAQDIAKEIMEKITK